MLPSKFRALNSDSSEESDSTEIPNVTKEALEQKAISKYQAALAYEQKGEWLKTEKLLRSLLKSDVLVQATGKLCPGQPQSSLVHLKYCVLLNLGHCFAKQDKLQKALEYYIKASEVDNTDLNLWFRIGKVALQVVDLTLAMSAFTEGLKCSPNHWPSIDHLVTVSYALGDYMTCLSYIAKGLKMDNGFLKGHAFKEKLFSSFPSLQKGFLMYYPECEFPSTPSDLDINCDECIEMFKEADSLQSKAEEKWQPVERKYDTILQPDVKVKLNSWVDVAKCLIYLHMLAEEKYPKQIAFCSVQFSASESNDEEPVEINDTGSEEEEEVEEKPTSQDDDEDQGKAKCNGGNLIERLVSSQKRRSARVRSTVRREEPSLAEVFKRLIPFHLLPLEPKKEGEGVSEELDTMDLYKLFEMRDASSTNGKTEGRDKFEMERQKQLKEEDYFFSIKEESEVKLFIEEAEDSRSNIYDTMQLFLTKLARKWKLHWPESLGKYFIEINQIVLQYYPPTVIVEENNRAFHDDVVILLYGELLLNEWLLKGKKKGLLSPLGKSLLGGDFCSLNLGLLNYRSKTTDDIEFIARSYWLEALLFLHCGDSEACVRALQQILDEPRCETISIKVPNSKLNGLISCKVVLGLIKALRRDKSLAQIVDLYNLARYKEVCEILSDALTMDSGNFNAEETMSRTMQFAIILDSYWKLGKYKDCLYWTECTLFETFSQFMKTNDEDERDEIAKIVLSTLHGLNSLLEKQGIILFKSLPPEKLVRLVQSLSSIINHQVSAPENTSAMPIETVKPWIILHYILKYDEENNDKVKKIFKEDEEEDLPVSIQILFQGHEYLGRRSWCCFDEGALLFHILNVVYPLTLTLPPESQNYANIIQQVDQIFYCLYEIQKKNKVRVLNDHKVLGLALTWNRAQQVFMFTRPKELPSYDSAGKSCMTADTETLYLRLINYVPDNCNPSRLLPEINKFIEGENDEIPRNDCLLPEEIKDIYYLLGHFYYRGKCWPKVWTYYLLDVSAHPWRYESWAGLALSRGAEIETKLNSCETIKNEAQFLSYSATVCRCYKKSLDLEPMQAALWIERGTFSYAIHSFCSSVLKKAQDLSIDMYTTLEEQKESMLGEAYQCYLSANKLWYECQGKDMIDERWLHHYMFGKISKKKDEDPTIFINHYMKAAALLHEIRATYPSLITYNSPQHLAVEALELFYRVHITILKSLEDAADKELPKTTMEIYKQAVMILSQSPFVTQVKEYAKPEKPKKVVVRRATESSNDDEYKVEEDEEEEDDEDEGDDEGLIMKLEDKPLIPLEKDELPVSKAIEDMVQNILEKVEGEQGVTNSLKRKLSLIADEPEGDQYAPPVKKTADSSVDPVIVIDEPKIENLPPEKPPEKAVEPAPTEASGTVKSKPEKSEEDNSSSSSSSSSSNSSNSSSSSSSSTSSSSSGSSSSTTSASQSEPVAKKQKVEKGLDLPENGDTELDWLIKKCLSALELCKKRFPEHYKSTYHLARFYFKNKKFKDIDKVKEILLGPKGLFGERRTTNFFNGIWRIPNGEIDRPGSFAAHMGRCVLLLLEFLRETKDYSMLFELALHLKITPEADKKYVRDGDREELSKEAAILCVQTLRSKIKDVKPEDLPPLVLEVYSMYKRAVKGNIREPKFSNVLIEVYSKLSTNQGNDSNVSLDNAIRYCQAQIQGAKQQAAGVLSGGVSSSSSLPPLTQSQPVLPTVGGLISAMTQQTMMSLNITPTSVTPTPLVVPPVQASPSILPESITTSALSVSTVAGVGRPRGRGHSGVTGTRKRGRPPGSSSGLRLPRSMSSFVSHQAELLRRYSQQNAELTRQLAAQSTVSNPVTPTLTQQTNLLSQATTSSVLNRGSLSITPVKPTPTTPLKPSPASPVRQVLPTAPAGSVPPKKASYKPRKQSPATPVSASPTQWGPRPQSPFNSSALSIRPIPPPMQSPSLPKTTTPEISLQHKILSAKKISPTQTPSSPLMPLIPPTNPLLSSANLSITPNTKSQAPLPKPPQSQHTIIKSTPGLSITPTPIVSITPTSIPQSSPISILPTTAAATHQSVIKKTSDLPYHPSHDLLASFKQQFSPKQNPDLPFHPSNELTVKQINTKQKPYNPRAQQAPAPRKELASSISITPASSKSDSSKSYSRPSISQNPTSLTDEKTKLASKIGNIDSSVADALRNFGSSITITATNKKPANIPQDEMSITPVQLTKPNKPPTVSEVIVLDD